MEAYSGTTLANYLKCAVVDRDRVHFIKAREPRNILENLFYNDNLQRAAYHALFNANKLGHTPLVIMGILTQDYHGEFPGNEHFPINKVRIPKDDSCISDCDPQLIKASKQKATDFFKEISPLEVIADMQTP